jgi:hypothetical protein
MKIYINNFNLNILDEMQKLLTKFLIETKTYIELYTNESIYHIDNNHIYNLEPKDGEIKVYNNYIKNITLIYDTSYFEKKTENSILGTLHVNRNITKSIYKINSKSKLSLVIEMENDSDNPKPKPNDVYFELNQNYDINEAFIYQEINEFLSVLN